MRGLGTLLNLATVLAGGLIGVYAGHLFPERMRRTIMQGLGLMTIAVAIVGLEPFFDEDLGLRRAIIALASLTVGAVIGEALQLEERLERFGERLQQRFDVPDDATVDQSAGNHSRFVEGFVVASTVFCVGPLTLLGSVEDGLGLDIRLLSIKSTLDGIAAIGFAAIYGWGVLASLITILVLQGGITLGASFLEGVFTGEVLAQLGAIGSLLILGIGLRILEIKQIRTVALLPAAVIGPAVAGAIEAWF